MDPQDESGSSPIGRGFRRFGTAVVVLVASAYLLLCAFSLPRTAVVRITGTEIMRKSVEQSDGKVRTQDIRYVVAQDLEGGPRMFRNGDTGWGWPPYLKFDSGDVSAEATNFSQDDDGPLVFVRYYGFRIRMLSAFPNIVSMREARPGDPPPPWFNLGFAVGHVLLLGVAAFRIRRWRRGSGPSG